MPGRGGARGMKQRMKITGKGERRGEIWRESMGTKEREER